MRRTGHSGASPLKKERLPEPISREEQRQIWIEVQRIRRELKSAKTVGTNRFELARRYEQLRNKIVESNLLYVKSMVHKYQRRISYALEAEDLIQEGRVALFEAFKKYELSRGTFLNYATKWINKYVFRAAEDRLLVRMPSHMHKAVRKTNRVLKQMIAEKEGERVDVADVAKNMGISTKKLEHIRQRAVKEFFSFDTPIGEGDDRSLADKLSSSRLTIEDLLARESLKPIVHQALDLLDARQALVLRTRFGIGNGGEYKTLEYVGQKLGMDRKHVWKVEKSALKKLRFIFTRRIFVGGEKEIKAHLE